MQTLLASPYRIKQKRTLRWRRASTQRYPGQIYDSESGLHHNGYRELEPGLGRYTQPDPIGLAGGISDYAYANGNPITHFDLTGLTAETCPTEDREKQCDYLHYEVDIPVCNGISRKRGADAARRCFASAAQRYASCLRGEKIPALDTTVWRNTGPDLPPQTPPQQEPTMSPLWWLLLIPAAIIGGLTGQGA